MRIKVGSVWFECERNTPIMIELTALDKENIKDMHPDATKYAIFADDILWSKEEKLEWME